MLVPGGKGLREKILRPPERLHGEVHRLRGLQGMPHDEHSTFRPLGRQILTGQGDLLWCRGIGEVTRAGELVIEVEHELAGHPLVDHGAAVCPRPPSANSWMTFPSPPWVTS